MLGSKWKDPFCWGWWASFNVEPILQRENKKESVGKKEIWGERERVKEKERKKKKRKKEGKRKKEKKLVAQDIKVRQIFPCLRKR